MTGARRNHDGEHFFFTLVTCGRMPIFNAARPQQLYYDISFSVTVILVVSNKPVP